MKTKRVLTRKIGLVIISVCFLAGLMGTFSPALAATTLRPPTNFRAQVNSPAYVSLSWNYSAPSSTIKIYIYRVTNSSFLSPAQIYTISPIDIRDSGYTFYEDNQVQPKTTYYYRLCAVQGSRRAYSTIVSVTTPDFPPAAPTEFRASAASETQINLTWKDNSNNEDGFRIEWGLDGLNYPNTIRLDIAGFVISSHEHSGLTPNTTYYYRIYAYNSGGRSSPYEFASATTRVAHFSISGTISGIASADFGSGLEIYASSMLVPYESYSATIHSNGPYTITGIPPGTYIVIPPQNLQYYYTVEPPHSNPLTLPDPNTGGNVDGINFTFTLLTYSVSGYVSDTNGQGIDNVNITITRQDGSVAGANTTHTDPSGMAGYYEITGLRPGGYTITATKTGLTFENNPRPITVVAGLNSCDFTATTNSYSISGWVRTPTGKGVEGAVVRAEASASEIYTDAVDASGNFTIENLAGGRNYLVRPQPLGNYTFGPTTRLYNNLTGSITGCTFTAQLSCSISGTVFKASGGALAGAQVILKDQNGAIKATTITPTGNFTLSVSHLDPGNYILTAIKAGYTIETLPIAVSPTNTNFTSQNFTLRLYKISGWVAIANGPGVEGVNINISGPNLSGTVTTDTSGNYIISVETTPSIALNEGNYILTPVKSGFAFLPYPGTVNLTYNQYEQALNFTATPSYNLSGFVRTNLTDASSGVNAVQVNVKNLSGTIIATTQTNPNSETPPKPGFYSFPSINLQAGYTIEAQKQGYDIASYIIQQSDLDAVNPNERKINKDLLAIYYTISGKVSKASDPASGLAGVSIEVKQWGGNIKGSVTTDANGIYSISVTGNPSIPINKETIYVLTPAKSGYRIPIASAIISAGSTLTQRYFTATAYEISGTVYEGSAPLSNLIVVISAGGTEKARIETSSLGTYKVNVETSPFIPLDKDTPYTVKAEKDDYAFTAQPENPTTLTEAAPQKTVNLYGIPQKFVKEGDCKENEPIDMSNGNFVVNATDLTIPGRGLDLVIKRTYENQMSYNGPFGINWEFNYNLRLKEDGNLVYYYHNGRKETYTRISGTNNYQAPAGYFDKLVKKSDGTFTDTEKDGTKYGFNSQGKLMRITDRFGNALNVSYPANSMVITDTLGRNTTFAFDATGKIIRITDPLARQINYQYDGDYLISVSYPEGSTMRYNYDRNSPDPNLSNNITSIIDGEGNEYVANTYGSNANDALTYDRITQQGWNRGMVYLEYQPNITINTDRRGIKTKYTFNDKGDVIRQEVNFGSSPVYITQYQHNSQRQRTQIIYPDGQRIENTYDANGNLITQSTYPAGSGQAQIVRYTYDTFGFNKVKTFTDALGNVVTYYYDFEEPALGDLNSDGRTNQAFGLLIKKVYPACDLALDGRSVVALEKFIYNDAGQILQEIDPLGYITKYEYQNGYLYRKIIDYGDSTHLNLTTTYAVDSVGNILRITDPKGYSTTMEYDAFNKPARIISALGLDTRIEYNKNGKVIKKKIGTGSSSNPYWTTQFDYDIDNLARIYEEVSAVADDNLKTAPLNQVAITGYSYNADDLQEESVSAQGRRTQTLYEERGLVRQVILDPQGKRISVSTQYDNRGRPIRITDANGNITQNEYDAFGRLTRTIAPEGSYKKLEYDNNNNVTKEESYNSSGALLGQVIYRYNGLGFPYQVEQRKSDGTYLISKVKFDLGGRKIEEIDPKGNSSRYVYDGAGRLMRSIDALGNIVENTYDANSNLIFVRSKETGETQDFLIGYAYDAINRPIRTNYYGRVNAGTTPFSPVYSENTTYDAANNKIERTDGEGARTRVFADGLGRKTREESEYVSNQFLVNTFSYDRDGKLLTFTDAKGNTTNYQYDNLGNSILTRYPDNSTLTYKYEYDLGMLGIRLKEETLQDGTRITYTYDRNGQVTRKNINYPFSRPGAVTYEAFTSDGLGRITRADNDFSSLEFNYNLFDQQISERLTVGSKVGLTQRTLDDVGNLIALTYPDGFQVRYNYDAINRITNIANANAAAFVNYEFKGAQRLYQKRFANGAKTWLGYDALDRATSYSHSTSNSGMISSFTYRYNKVNNVTIEGRNMFRGATTPSTTSYWYYYDKAGRLKQVGKQVGSRSATIEENFTLDLAGNRQGSNNKILGKSITYDAANMLNQYLGIKIGSSAKITLEHDPQGNLKKDTKSNLYTYDYANRLVKATNASGATLIEFTYDVLGRRIKKTEAGKTTYFFHNAGETIYKEVVGTSTEIQKFVYGPKTDELICIIKGSNTYYYHPKAMQSACALTDSAGAIAEYYDFDSFGNLTVRNKNYSVISANKAINLITFTAREYEPGIDKFYYRARFYDAYLGRFMQRDPVGYSAGQNLYTYCDNNPVNLADPLGLEAESYIEIGFTRRSGFEPGFISLGPKGEPGKAIFTTSESKKVTEGAISSMYGGLGKNEDYFLARIPVSQEQLDKFYLTGYRLIGRKHTPWPRFAGGTARLRAGAKTLENISKKGHTLVSAELIGAAYNEAFGLKPEDEENYLRVHPLIGRPGLTEETLLEELKKRWGDKLKLVEVIGGIEAWEIPSRKECADPLKLSGELKKLVLKKMEQKRMAPDERQEYLSTLKRVIKETPAMFFEYLPEVLAE